MQNMLQVLFRMENEFLLSLLQLLNEISSCLKINNNIQRIKQSHKLEKLINQPATPLAQEKRKVNCKQI